jgi:hypothetical protein
MNISDNMQLSAKSDEFSQTIFSLSFLELSLLEPEWACRRASTATPNILSKTQITSPRVVPTPTRHPDSFQHITRKYIGSILGSKKEAYTAHTSSTAQCGGGSFKNRKPIREIGCSESRMAERSQ